MRSVLLPFLFGLSIAHAQHCGYDFSSIIVVRPHGEGDSAVIDGLRITLLDSNNIPVLVQGQPYHLFKPNDDPDACGQRLFGFARGQCRCFPFAKDNYVLVIREGMKTETMRILVQDDDRSGYVNRRQKRWQEGYAQQVIPLTAFDSYPLCGRYDDTVYPALKDRPQYQPVDITVKRR